MGSSNIRLPVELLFQILLSSGLSLADLAVLSRVCRSWYRAIFPELHDTVYLSWNAPIFAARILDEHLTHHALSANYLGPAHRRPSPPIDGLRVANYVHNLVLDNRLSRAQHTFHQLESDIMTAAFPMLKNLKRIDWRLRWLPDYTDMFVAWTRYCSDIQHFSFGIPTEMRRYQDYQFEDMFSLSNLKYIRLKDLRLPPDPETIGYVSPSLMAMIMRSPELEYLELELSEGLHAERHGGRTGWLVEAIAPVLEHTFKNLRAFSLKGSADINSDNFVRSDQYNLVRDFLFRHPNLHTLELPWDGSMNTLINGSIKDHAQSLSGALPGLHHFVGPTYLVVLFLQLDIAQNLERLGIYDFGAGEESDLFVFTDSLPRLPNLRRLDFLSTFELECLSFAGLLKATPNITELTVMWIDGDCDPEIIKTALIGLPHLKYLNLGPEVIPLLANRWHDEVSKEHESDEVFQLASRCHNLVQIRILPEGTFMRTEDVFDHQTYWYIRRYANGSIEVTFSSLRESPEIGEDLMLDACYHEWAYDTFTDEYWGFTSSIEIE